MTETLIQPQTYDPRQAYDLDVSSIYADETFNCRGIIDPTSLLELGRSIDEKGLLSPILVRVYNNPAKPQFKFQVVSGFRRFKAHKVIQKPTILALVRNNIDEVEARILNLTENLQREDLNPKQEAHAINHLRFLGQEEIAARLNKSRGWVQNRLLLLELPEDIQDQAAAGILSMKQVTECARLPSIAMMYDYVRGVIDSKLKRTTEPTAEKVLKANVQPRLRNLQEIEELQSNIQKHFGTTTMGRLLGWAAGHVTDDEITETLINYGHDLGIAYEPVREAK